ncbi:amidohydrolase family protein [Janibacter hoylei]|uniref:amidohydrolase family protein n=1 Tax=Janibacter hoylei TaxID=364298 RepID=UPI002492BF7A|nr:amidohydrolase family protein [Janibacter hoylei]
MELQAIDVHVHPRTPEFLAALGGKAAAMDAYFGSAGKAVSFDQLADLYRSLNMMAVLQNTTDIATTGNEPVSNEVIGAAVAKHPDVFIGFGIIEPLRVAEARDEIKRCREEYGLVGIGELNPGRQFFYPNDARFYPLWEEAMRQDMIVLFHTGMMGAGAGTPGGSGFKLKYNRPVPHIDDLAADFPDLRIIGAHPSWPWVDEGLAIARHKSNFYIDMSGWAPKYFPESFVRYARGPLADKMLFGSDWPFVTPSRWLAEFDELGFSPEVRRKILLENAASLFGIDLDQPPVSAMPTTSTVAVQEQVK